MHTAPPLPSALVHRYVELRARSKAVFVKHDTDGSGSIGVDELKRALSDLGLALRDAEVDRYVAKYDVDHDRVIDLDEFRVLMAALGRGLTEQEVKQAPNI